MSENTPDPTPTPATPAEPRIEWAGNPLRGAGCEAEHGGIKAELMRVAPDVFGVLKSTREIRRTWILHLMDANRFKIGGPVLTCVLIHDSTPAAAMREAEKLMRWAAAYAREAEVDDGA